MARRSIRKQLTQRLLLGMLTISVISISALYLYLRQELFEEYNAALVTEARAISSVLCSDESDAELAELIHRSFPRMHLGPEEHGFLQVWNDEGRIVIRSTSLAGGDVPVIPQASSFEYPIVADVTLPDGKEGRATSLKFDRNPPADDARPKATPLPQKKYVMTLAVRRDELNETLDHLVVSLASIGVGLTLAAVMLVVFGVRHELKPLAEFSEQVAHVDASTLAYRFTDGAVCDELLPIRERLNDLLARLDASFKRERRFSANVAHELRTPIAELRSMIEVAIKWPLEPDGIARLHEQILEVSTRMTGLVEAMFALIRIEHGPQPICAEQHTLAQITDAAWTRVLAAQGPRVDCEMQVDSSIQVAGDRTMLEGLIGNLLANASQHGVPGTQMRCIARAATPTEGACLAIFNTTADLQPVDLAHLDEPFWRKDAVRTPGHRLGLGLSLVRDYAKAMAIDVRFAMPEATLFVVQLCWSPNPATTDAR